MRNLERRTFLEAAAIFPLIALGQSSAAQRSDRAVRVERGVDRFNQQRTIAGANQTFFQEAAKISDFAADEKLYRACEMEIVGPPLSLV